MWRLSPPAQGTTPSPQSPSNSYRLAEAPENTFLIETEQHVRGSTNKWAKTIPENSPITNISTIPNKIPFCFGPLCLFDL
jgi:hypothetical protein